MKTLALKITGDTHFSKAIHIVRDKVTLSFNKIIKLCSIKIRSKYLKIFKYSY